MTVYLCTYDDVQEDFMPDEPKPERPTRAAMDALGRKVDLLETLLETARMEARDAVEDRDRWREAHAPDVEAEAIAGCVRALEGMSSGDRRAAMNPNAASYPYDFPMGASSSPVGRVLLHLAARYGVPLEPSPLPVFEAPAERLVVLPAALADQLDRAGFGRIQ